MDDDDDYDDDDYCIIIIVIIIMVAMVMIHLDTFKGIERHYRNLPMMFIPRMK